MAENEPEKVEESGGDETQPKPLMKILLLVGIVFGGAGAGYFAASFLMNRPSQAVAATTAPQDQEDPPLPPDDNEESVYHDFDPITVNLDEPRMARYIRATIIVAVKSSLDGDVAATLERRKPMLRDWLTRYFAGCTLEQVRGTTNLNRIRREIKDAFNEMLWPNRRPRIDNILFKEFAIQ